MRLRPFTDEQAERHLCLICLGQKASGLEENRLKGSGDEMNNYVSVILWSV